MNQHKFFIFFLYIIDLKNLSATENLAICHPRHHAKVQTSHESFGFEKLSIGDMKSQVQKEDMGEVVKCPYCAKTNFGSKQPMGGLKNILPKLTRMSHLWLQNQKTCFNVIAERNSNQKVE